MPRCQASLRIFRIQTKGYGRFQRNLSVCLVNEVQFRHCDRHVNTRQAIGYYRKLVSPSANYLQLPRKEIRSLEHFVGNSRALCRDRPTLESTRLTRPCLKVSGLVSVTTIDPRCGTRQRSTLASQLWADDFVLVTDNQHHYMEMRSTSISTDALGSTVALADSSGTVQTSYTYDPFGKPSSTGCHEQQHPTVHRTPERRDGTAIQPSPLLLTNPAALHLRRPVGLRGRRR